MAEADAVRGSISISTVTKKRVSEKIIEDYLTCSVCSQLYSDPRLLNCCHFFCKLCIQNSCPVPDPPGSCFVFTCPTCGRKTDLPDNDAGSLNCAYFVRQKEELHSLVCRVEEGKNVQCSSCETWDKAVAFCFDCATLICESCKDMHTVKKVKKFKGHKIIDIDDIRNGVDPSYVIKIPNYCHLHSTDSDTKPLEYYCVDCQKVVCKDGFIMDHRPNGHTYEPVKRLAPDCRKYFSERLSFLKKLHTEVQQAIEQVKGVENEVSNQLHETRKEVHEKFAEIANAIESQKQTLLQHAQGVADVKLKHLQQQQGELESTHKNIREVVQFTEDKLDPKHCTDDNLLSLNSFLTSRIQEAIKDYEKSNLQLVTTADMTVRASAEEISKFLKQNTSISSSIDISKCLVEGEGIVNPKCGAKCIFTLHLKYRNGHTCLEDKRIVIVLKSLVDESLRIATEIVKESIGVYKIIYHPQIRGRHSLLIQVDGEILQHIPSSVFVEYPPRNFISAKPLCCISKIDKIDKPYSVLLGFNGEIIVTEESASIVYIARVGGKFELKRRVPLSTDRSEIQPSGLALDKESEKFYVGDCVGNRVLIYDKEWNNIGELNKKVQRPGKITIGKDGLIYVCERGSHKIKIFNKEGEEIRAFETSAQRPVDVKFDSRNNCYVSDVNGGRILKYDTNRDLCYVINEKHKGQQLASPRGMYIHKEYLYVAERDSNHVLIFKTDGEFIGEFSVPNAMNDPSGIVADEDGFLFVCDEVCRCVFIF